MWPRYTAGVCREQVLERLLGTSGLRHGEDATDVDNDGGNHV